MPTTNPVQDAPSLLPSDGAGRIRGYARGLAVGLPLLIAAMAVSVFLGSRELSGAEILDALTGHITAENRIVVDLRVPRMVAACVAGAGFAVAGVLMQALTRNPLAEPGLLGVNAGAAFLVALASSLLGATTTLALLPFAFAGALGAAVVVFAVGGAVGGASAPVRLVLTGVAFGAILSGVTNAVVLADRKAFNAMNAWRAGSLEGVRDDQILPIVAPVAVGVLLAAVLARSLDALVLGEDRARAMGVHTTRVKGAALVAITLLAGGATALAGPIGFVGLLVPFIARAVVGSEQRALVVLAIVIGPAVVLLADTAGRFLLPNGEVAVGVVMGVVGAPVIVYLARRARLARL